MREKKFVARIEAFGPEKAFWLGAVICVALLVVVTAVSGGPVPSTARRIDREATSAGTLIFGTREQTAMSNGSSSDYPLNHPETRDALTFRSYSRFDSVSEFSQRLPNDSPAARALNPGIADPSFGPTKMPPINEPIVSRAGAPGLAPMQIALDPVNAFTVPEWAPPNAGTWFATALAAGLIVWSLRRRFTWIFQRP